MTRLEPSAAFADSAAIRAQLDQEMAERAGLTISDFARLRKKLREARDAIELKVAAHVELAKPSESHLADELDQASRDQDMGFSLLLAGKDRSLKTDIDEALKRLDNGTYGLCEGTDEPIGLGRLEARPWTRYSVGYQEQLEREQRSRGGR